MTVLVLTRQLLDGPADLVVHELNRRGVPVHRVDPAEFPRRMKLAARIGAGQADWAGGWRGQYRDLRFDDVTAVYYRRPGPAEVNPALAEEDAVWARAEARAGFTGLVESLRCPWINHPRQNIIADSKPRALAAAVRSGLRIPSTLITNDPEEARDFISSLPERLAVYKPIAPQSPIGVRGATATVWTSPPLTADELTDEISCTAHLFQEWIAKQFEVRLTVVGNRLFAGAIHAHSDEARIDFRRDYHALTFTVCSVPEAVARGVRSLMSAFDLRYAAMDFLVGPQGEWHFVDLNPNGQFGFIPELAQPITRSLVDLLEGESV
ncbi:ATP-grasp ribosomal peptide maturase [Streptomyces sp. JH002]|uniref:ATP-grasp ribosomal peptide maturase n=1 Tax=Streptomyces sp. JH002 TaxID=2763259 RepID=UPI003D800E6F